MYAACSGQVTPTPYRNDLPSRVHSSSPSFRRAYCTRSAQSFRAATAYGFLAGRVGDNVPSGCRYVRSRGFPRNVGRCVAGGSGTSRVGTSNASSLSSRLSSASRSATLARVELRRATRLPRREITRGTTPGVWARGAGCARAARVSACALPNSAPLARMTLGRGGAAAQCA